MSSEKIQYDLQEDNKTIISNYHKNKNSSNKIQNIKILGWTMSRFLNLLDKIGIILFWLHNKFKILVLKCYLRKQRKIGVSTIEHEDLYIQEIKAIDWWALCWVISSLFIYVIVSCFGKQYLQSNSFLWIGLIFAFWLICVFRCLDILIMLLQLHLSDKIYVPHSAPRAIVGTFFQFIEVTAIFANTYILARVWFGKKAFCFPKDGDLLDNLVHPIYYSFVTFTTLGYGDIYPVHWAVQLIVIVQLIIGLIFLVVVFQHVVSVKKTRVDE